MFNCGPNPAVRNDASFYPENSNDSGLIEIEQLQFEPRADARTVIVLVVAVIPKAMNNNFGAPKFLERTSARPTWISILLRILLRAFEQISSHRVPKPQVVLDAIKESVAPKYLDLNVKTWELAKKTVSGS